MLGALVLLICALPCRRRDAGALGGLGGDGGVGGFGEFGGFGAVNANVCQKCTLLSRSVGLAVFSR